MTAVTAQTRDLREPDDDDDEVQRLMDAGDNIGALCLLVKQAGLTMTLHGVPVSADELRAAAKESAVKRIVDVLTSTPTDRSAV